MIYVSIAGFVVYEIGVEFFSNTDWRNKKNLYHLFD